MTRLILVSCVLVTLLSGCAMMNGFFDAMTGRPDATPVDPSKPVATVPDAVPIDRDTAYGLGGALGALLSAFLVRKYGVSLLPGVSKTPPK